MAEDWKSQAARSRNVQQIAELLRLAPNSSNKNATDLENQMFGRSKKKEDYLQMLARVLNHLKEQVQPSSQNNPHLAAMLTGQAVPQQMNQNQMNQGQMSQGQMTQGQMTQGQMTQGQMTQGQMTQGQMTQGQMSQGQMTQVQMSQGQMTQGQMTQGQMTQSQMTQGQMTQGQMTQGQMTQGQMSQGQMGGQGNQQMQMGGHVGQQQQQLGQGQISQGNQMSSQQIAQVAQMGNTLGQGNPQLGQGQMVVHGSQGMGMGGLGQQMGMGGGISVSHGQPMGMGGQPNQMGPNTGPMNRMGAGAQVIGGPLTMVGQTASSMGMGGGQVISNTNAGMMSAHNQGMVGSRMTSAIGIPGQGGDMSWQGANSHMSMGMKPGMGGMQGPMGNKMGTIQMAIGGQGGAGGGQIGGMGRGGMSVAGAGTVASMQPRIPSPSYPGAPGGGLPRQNIPSSVSIASPNMAQSTQPQLMASSQHSPAFISPSPSSSMVPSPVGSSCRGSVMGAPSPSTGMVNTPGQPMQQSPAAGNQMEDKAYLEKVKELQKYVELLKSLIAKGSNEEGGNKAEAGKMRKLLDLLQNPRRRMPMETLERCEEVLKKLEVKEPLSQHVHKESAVEVLMEGIRNALNAPNSANVFHRTIAPALEKLTGCYIPMPPPAKKRCLEAPQKDPNTPKISYVIQGEVARLSPRFKVNLDSQQPPGSDDLSLICHLDDSNLPCVPPLTLTIPTKYPDLPPVATLSLLEYSTTDFLKRVHDRFLRRQQHLPLWTSITMMLDTWEMSIRHACSPNAANNPDAVSPITAIMELTNEKWLLE